MSKTCFVTGGSGFVGRYLIPELLSRGYSVRALARSDASARAVSALGAEAVYGDLGDFEVLLAGMAGCAAVFHLAAALDFDSSAADLHRLHVEGTQHVVAAAQQARVGQLVYLGAASVVANPSSLTLIPETYVAPRLYDGYSQTKLQAEQLVLAANGPGLQTYAVRPPLIWGDGFSGYALFKKQAESGQFRFVNGGRHIFSTCHVRNLVAALLLVLEKSPGGEIYFITDGETWTVQRFFTTLLQLYGLPHNFGSLSYGVASFMAGLLDVVWRLFGLKSHPPLTRNVLYLFGKELTLSDQKIRQRLGFRNVITIGEGFRELKQAQTMPAQTT